MYFCVVSLLNQIKVESLFPCSFTVNKSFKDGIIPPWLTYSGLTVGQKSIRCFFRSSLLYSKIMSCLRSYTIFLYEGEANVFSIFDFLAILFIQPVTEAEFCFPGFSFAANAHQSHPHME